MVAEVTKPDFQYVWASGGAIVAPSTVKGQTGWTAEVPPFQWENYLQNRQDNAILHLFQKGISEWDAASNYYFTTSGTRSYVQGSDGNIYVAVQDSIGQNPVTDTTNTYWKKAFSSPEDSLLRAGVVGSAVNTKMSIATATTTATLTADEVIVKTALAGTSYILPSFSKSINLAIIGAGGMDTGTAPISGFVAIYAIYNPTTGASSLLAKSAPANQTEIYSGANMPSGYTASALVSVVKTNASSQFFPTEQYRRTITTAVLQAFGSVTQQATYAALSIQTLIPPNAKTIQGTLAIGSSTLSAASTMYLASAASGVGEVQAGLSGGPANLNSYCNYANLPISSSQTIYYKLTSNGAVSVANIFISGYTF